MSVKKAIIPVAGFGTRFLPATKALPKEMLPVVDKPVVQYVVEELIDSGITDIIFVTGQNKRAIEDHFDYHPELESWLEKSGKDEALTEVRKIAELANFIYIRQKGPYGNGTPILNARHLIGDEPFVVVWGDDIFYSDDKPRVKQLIEVYEKYQNPVMTCIDITDEETKKYGVIDADEVENNIYKVKKLVEKPGPDAMTSRLGTVSGYVLTPDIFDILENTSVRMGELWLVDAISQLGEKRPIYAAKVDAKFYDIGSKHGLYKANLDFGLRDDELRESLKKMIDEVK